MYESSLTENLLDPALKNTDSRRIMRVNLLIGPFSEERKESIRFYWRDLAKDSFGEGAGLHFDHMPVEIKCLDCTGAFYLDEETSMCKFYYGERLQLSKGEDVWLESIELE